MGARIRSWFTHNTVLKLISLLLAFVVWIIVVNTSNPKVSSSVSVAFDVLNEVDASSSGELYTLNYSSVTISYDVRSKYRNSVTQNSFTAYVNMEDYTEENPEIPVYLEVDSSVSNLIDQISIEPSTVRVYRERIQQKKFAVQYSVIGQPASGYAMGEVSITPEYSYVKGPLSVMGQISSIGITINIEGATETVEGTSTIEFYDANGNELNGIEDSLSFAGDISYTVPIYRIKSLTVNAFTGGAPASGYAVESVETNPTFISVYGPEEILNEYSYILIPANDLSISGITENHTFNINAIDYLPEGLSLVEPKTEITILVKVKSIQKEVEVKPASETPAEPEETVTAAASEPVPSEPSEMTEQAAASESAETTADTDATEIQNAEPEHDDSESEATEGETTLSSDQREERDTQGHETEPASAEETLPAAQSE